MIYQYKDLSVLIIDDISMVGSGMFNLIYDYSKSKVFVVIHVITFGDLFQRNDEMMVF